MTHNLTKSLTAVVMQSPHSPAESYSCVLRTQVSNGLTICLLIAEDDTRINDYIEKLQARRKKVETSPLYFISLVAEDYGYKNEVWRESLDRFIFDRESIIHAASFYTDIFDEKSDEMQRMIVKLHRTKNRLIWLDCTTHFELALVKYSQEMVELYESLRQDRGLTTLSTSHRTLLQQETNFHQNACLLRRYQAQGLQQRVQTQINIASDLARSKSLPILTLHSSTLRFPSEMQGSTYPSPEIPEKSPSLHSRTAKP